MKGGKWAVVVRVSCLPDALPACACAAQPVVCWRQCWLSGSMLKGKDPECGLPGLLLHPA